MNKMLMTMVAASVFTAAACKKSTPTQVDPDPTLVPHLSEPAEAPLEDVSTHDWRAGTGTDLVDEGMEDREVIDVAPSLDEHAGEPVAPDAPVAPAEPEPVDEPVEPAEEELPETELE